MCFVLFCFKDFIYLFDRERERERAQTEEIEGRGRERSRLPLSREPDVGLDPRTPGP